MLETEIKALREEIAMLRDAITAMGENIIQKPKDKKAAPAAPAPAPEAPAPAPAPAASSDQLKGCINIIINYGGPATKS